MVAADVLAAPQPANAVGEAAKDLEAALAMSIERGDDTQASHLLNHLAAASLQIDERVQAGALAERALTHARRTGERLAQQTALQVLAQLAWADGDMGRARHLFTEALRRAVELSDDVNVAYCLRGIAVCDDAGGGSDDAARLLGAADAVLEAAGHPRFAWLMPDVEDAVSAAFARAVASVGRRASYDAGRAAGIMAADERLV